MLSNGTTACETFIAILPSSVFVFITVLLNSLLFTYITKQREWYFVIEFMCLVLPIILSVTILSKYLKIILFTAIVIAAHLVFLIFNINPTKLLVANNESKTSYITNARSTINFLSVIAILAVDFKVFPRNFAKTDAFGYSLMDVGVGLFMYSNGIVAPEARGRKNSFIYAFRSSLPLFILGLARFVLVKQTDYKFPVSEYGVHWNFFFTLAVTKIICGLILSIFKIWYVFISAVFLVVIHEGLLQAGLKDFSLAVVTRDNFIVANKEGIVSSLGYVSIYLFSVCFGYLVHLKTFKKSTSKFAIFLISSMSALILSIILGCYFGVSRKLANSAYCFWVLFIGIFMTGLYYLWQLIQEYFYKGRLHGLYSPLIFEAVNYNGLVFFLTGNVLTGLVNLTFYTLTINDTNSIVILSLYMFLNCLIVTILYLKQYKLKL